MTVTYTINHAISPELETWLAAQPDFVSIDIQPTSTNVYYDHASEAEELAFKNLLADQLGLAGENVNTSDADLFNTSGVITPAALTADVDDWNPTGYDTNTTLIRADGDGWSISGLVGGTDGRIITIVQVGTGADLTIFNDDAGSAAANRFKLVYGVVTLDPNESMMFRYDGITQRWRPLTNSNVTSAIRNRHIGALQVTGDKLDVNTSWNLGSGAGVKIGTATTQKLGFYNATPVVQPAANADTSGATLGQLETEVNELKAMLRSLGLMAT